MDVIEKLSTKIPSQKFESTKNKTMAVSHEDNFQALIKYTKANSREDREEAQYGCLLIDTKGDRFYGVSTYEGCEDMKDAASKYIHLVHACNDAGKKWEKLGKENPIEYAYVIPCFPCGVDQVCLAKMGIKNLVVPRAHPVITKSWTNFKVHELAAMFFSKELGINLIYLDQNIYSS